MASNWIGKIATKLVHLPKTMVEAGREMTAVCERNERRISPAPFAEQYRHTFTYEQFRGRNESAPVSRWHSLSPGHRRSRAEAIARRAATAWWNTGVLTSTARNRTLVVPSGHPTHRNPEGIQEVKRILKLHLKGKA